MKSFLSWILGAAFLTAVFPVTGFSEDELPAARSEKSPAPRGLLS